MREAAVARLRMPGTGEPCVLCRVDAEEHGEIRTGTLAAGDVEILVREFIPRFVEEPPELASFGEQWNRFRRTQLDKFNGTTITRQRFFGCTGWTAEDLRGSRVLEVGCGAGRFTDVLLDAGAEVTAIDSSTAVDACWRNHGPHPRLTIVQADLFQMPLERESFDRVFCYGVLQHTPNVERAFHSLLPFVRSGGEIAVDVYLRYPWVTRWTAKYWYRGITKRLSPQRLQRIVGWYVPRWLPVDTWCSRVPLLRSVVPAVVPCWNYTGILRELTPDQIREWAVLDTFDALAPRYDHPRSVRAVRRMFQAAGLASIHVRAGGNGVLGNARKL